MAIKRFPWGIWKYKHGTRREYLIPFINPPPTDDNIALPKINTYLIIAIIDRSLV